MNYGLSLLFSESNAKLGFDPMCFEGLDNGEYALVMKVESCGITWQLHAVETVEVDVDGEPTNVKIISEEPVL